MKIIIDYEGDAADALRRVLSVVENGRVSTAVIRGNEVRHFCWVTTWKDGSGVTTRRKDHATAADSFQVWRNPTQQPPSSEPDQSTPPQDVSEEVG